MCNPGRLKVSIVPLSEITGPSTSTAYVWCIIPSFYKNFTFVQVELEAVKSPFQSPSFVIYSLMYMHNISLAPDPDTFKPRSD